MKVKLVKLDVSPYFLTKVNLETRNPETIVYQVNMALSNMLYHPDLQLSMESAIDRKNLSERLESCNEGFILLTTDDFTKIKGALEIVKGYGKDDVEFLKRIKNAEEIEVEISEKI